MSNSVFPTIASDNIMIEHPFSKHRKSKIHLKCHRHRWWISMSHASYKWCEAMAHAIAYCMGLGGGFWLDSQFGQHIRLVRKSTRTHRHRITMIWLWALILTYQRCSIRNHMQLINKKYLAQWWWNSIRHRDCMSLTEVFCCSFCTCSLVRVHWGWSLYKWGLRCV